MIGGNNPLTRIGKVQKGGEVTSDRIGKSESGREWRGPLLMAGGKPIDQERRSLELRSKKQLGLKGKVSQGPLCGWREDTH
jgi:hypothetical protein